MITPVRWYFPLADSSWVCNVFLQETLAGSSYSETADATSISDEILADMPVDFRVGGGSPLLGQMTSEEENELSIAFYSTKLN